MSVTWGSMNMPESVTCRGCEAWFPRVRGSQDELCRKCSPAKIMPVMREDLNTFVIALGIALTLSALSGIISSKARPLAEHNSMTIEFTQPPEAPAGWRVPKAMTMPAEQENCGFGDRRGCLNAI